MKKKQYIIGICAAFFCSACNNNDPIESFIEDKGIRFTITDFVFDTSSRTAVEITDQAAIFTWAANDTIGIFPDADASQARFIMTDGAGTKSATFDGGGWALRADAKYASYYPYIPDVNLDKTSIPVDYRNQKQYQNASTSHLGDYDFMAASAIVPTDGQVSFDYKHLGCLLQLKLNMPEVNNYTAITLKSNNNIFVSRGVYNLMADQISVIPTAYQDSINLVLDNVVNTSDIVAYLMIPPMNLSLEDVDLFVYSGNHINAKGRVSLKNFVSGTAYTLSASLSDVSDTPIEEGVTEITTAGSLDDLLGDSMFKLTKLSLKGKINGDDIATLRRMSGGFRDTTDVEFGILKELDLSKVSIVSGGSYYMDNGDTRYRVTTPGEINSCMFFGCNNLESIVLPDNVTTIEEAAFSSCSNLHTVVLPSGVTSIGVAAFNGCSSLSSITLPPTLFELGGDAFHSCKSLQCITIPNTLQTINVNTFGHCISLTDIILSDGLETIANGAFAACDKLVSIVIPNTVKTIGERAFASCSSLENVTLSSGTKQLKSYTFENCTAIKKIVIPEGVETIQSRTFQYCSNITEITIPSSLKSIGDRAFYAAAANSPINVLSYAVNPPTLGTNVWKGGNNVANSILFVQSDNVSSYKSSSWNSYFGEIKPIE